MMQENGQLPVGALVLGASGYVAGELLRWVAGHPEMRLAAAVSASHAGLPIAESFPNLAAALGDAAFVAPAELPRALERAAGEHSGLAAFSAAPHKASAPQVAALIEAADAVGCELPVVDLSADFRHSDPARYQAIYGIPHPAPDLLREFTCGLTELTGDDAGAGPGRVAHPGCFATAAALAAAPLRRAGLVEPDLHVSAVTGSTGSGGMPKETTHHPLRHANLFAYKPLRHRHAPEMEDLLAAPGEPPARVRFVPHSGPFARGIHATVFARSRSPLTGRRPRRGVPRLLCRGPAGPRRRRAAAQGNRRLGHHRGGRRHRRRDRRRLRRPRQPRQGGGERRRPVDEPPARVPRRDGTHGPHPAWL